MQHELLTCWPNARREMQFSVFCCCFFFCKPPGRPRRANFAEQKGGGRNDFFHRAPRDDGAAERHPPAFEVRRRQQQVYWRADHLRSQRQPPPPRYDRQRTIDDKVSRSELTVAGSPLAMLTLLMEFIRANRPDSTMPPTESSTSILFKSNTHKIIRSNIFGPARCAWNS
jgi:hypothetical protein